MRIKIAFLTVLVLNVIGLAAYWVFHFLSIELLWFSHEYMPLKHNCPGEDIPTMGMAFILQLCGVGIAVGVGMALFHLSKAAVIRLYKKIDSIFPERKPS